MKISRHYTTPNQSPYAEIEFRLSKSEIRNPDGSMVFSLDEVEVPLDWSQVATDILAQKYLRRAGVPARVRRLEEEGVPSFLWRSEADTAELAALPAAARYGSEHSAIQVFDRLAGAWTYWGWKRHYFDGVDDAQAFFDELRFMLAQQIAAPTPRNGSTPASTGPMASTAPARAITTSNLTPIQL